MNINIFCRIRSSNRVNITSKIDFDRNNTMVSRINGPSFRFNGIFKENDDVSKIQDTCLGGLINAAINGLNSSLLIFGETGSGKSYSLAGNDSDRMGMFAASIRDLFSKLTLDEKYHLSKVYLRMFEVHNDALVDLMDKNTSTKFAGNTVSFTAEEGYNIKGITEVNIDSAAQAVVLFRDTWSRRILYSKSDPVVQCATIVQIKLFLKDSHENSKDTVNQMSFVYFPGDEILVQEKMNISRKRTENSVLAISKLLEELTESATIFGSYSNSPLTTLLEDQLGGNCVTHALLCLPANPNPDILAEQLRTMDNLSKVKTCPIVNTEYARKLLYGLRLYKKQFFQDFLTDLKFRPDVQLLNPKTMLEDLKLSRRENAELRDKVETLELKLEKLRNRQGHPMMNKSDISDDFIQKEEDKLRSSKKIMELEIQNSKSKEQLETVRFELSNKILHLEEKVMNLELEKALYIEKTKDLNMVKKDKNELNIQLLKIQKAYEDLQNETSLIISKNKELNLEFVNMLKVKNKVIRNDMDPNNKITLPEIENEKGFHRFNQDRRPLNTISSQEDTTLKLRLGKLQDLLHKALQTSQERLQEISKLSVNYIVLKDENEQLNVRMKELTKSLRSITLEYQQRIRKYAINMSAILDKTTTNERQYKEEIIGMLKRYDSSRHINENHLKELLEDCKKQYNYLRKWSERIVFEYIKLRNKIIEDSVNSDEIGPDPVTIADDYSLPKDYFNFIRLSKNKKELTNIMELKQQIKEFSNATQSNLEIERAQLLARNAELEEELISAQNYIEMYIKKKPSMLKKQSHDDK